VKCFSWFVVGTQLAGIVPFEFNQRRRRRRRFFLFYIYEFLDHFSLQNFRVFSIQVFSSLYTHRHKRQRLFLAPACIASGFALLCLLLAFGIGVPRCCCWFVCVEVMVPVKWSRTECRARQNVCILLLLLPNSLADVLLCVDLCNWLVLWFWWTLHCWQIVSSGLGNALLFLFWARCTGRFEAFRSLIRCSNRICLEICKSWFWVPWKCILDIHWPRRSLLEELLEFNRANKSVGIWAIIVVNLKKECAAAAAALSVVVVVCLFVCLFYFFENNEGKRMKKGFCWCGLGCELFGVDIVRLFSRYSFGGMSQEEEERKGRTGFSWILFYWIKGPSKPLLNRGPVKR